ncbi:MAG TPA: Fe-S cluster assembly protein IscX [Bryobacteraceae bacterium]|jgi:FeS assembly protein IscX|nr:Fe-S cluster assembly protein IscX [Bryobacteraceae bacterium]
MIWTDAEDIALSLLGKYPAIDPLTVRFTDLRRWVTALPDFEDDPQNVSESKLEAIQMAWYEEWKDSRE